MSVWAGEKGPDDTKKYTVLWGWQSLIFWRLPGLWQPVDLTPLLSENTKTYLKSHMINKFNLIATISPHKMSVEKFGWENCGSLTSQSYNGEGLENILPIILFEKKFHLENVHQIPCLSHLCPLSVRIRVKGLDWSEKVKCRNTPLGIYRKLMYGGRATVYPYYWYLESFTMCER